MNDQVTGLAVLILVGAIVGGYAVYVLMPKQHYPHIAGVLAANAIVGALSFAGVRGASDVLATTMGFSIFLMIYFFIVGRIRGD